VRDPRGPLDLPDRAAHGLALDAGHHQGAGRLAVDVVPLREPVHVRRVLRVLRVGARRGQPHAVRPARSRVRARPRLPPRVPGMRNLLFFMAEWGNLYVIGAIVTTLFLGGWHIPFTFGNPIVQHGLEFATFFLKAYGVGGLAPSWLRWTLPRIRVDQMMTMCWKYLVPIAFVNLLGAAAWMLWVPAGGHYPPTAPVFPA